MNKQKAFVYVVCGDKSHTDTLNFSLRYLRQFSKCPIHVITDLSRNEGKIEHDSVYDIKTPDNFNHHQASIFLKTALHRMLLPGPLYCYLDSDVIAIDPDVDKIFEQYEAPVTFAPDHCAMREFSPYAVNCSCNSQKKEKYAELDKLQQKHNPNMQINDPFLQEKTRRLINAFNIEKQNKWRYAGLIARYFLSFPLFRFNSEFYLDKRKKVWFYEDGRPVLYDIKGYYRKIEKESIFRWQNNKQIWLDETGENAYIAYCNHLACLIEEKFNVTIEDKNWQHWNGGVFLFDENTHNFMDTWHDFTMKIFEDPAWKTRDQGTLIATAWKFGLQNHKTLPPQFNFIADYHKKNLCFDKDKGFSTDKFKTIINPAFIHVYHEFGRKDWDVWQAIEQRINQ